MQKVHSYDSSNGPVEYCDSGRGAVTVALSGAMGGWDQSQILADVLAPKGRVVAISRPGYLGTPLSSGASPEQQADLIAELLDHLGIERAVVMAISGGGYSALTFAHRHPQRCRGLVLCSTLGEPNAAKIPFSFTVMTWLAGFKPLIQMMKRGQQKNPDAALKRGISDDAVRARFLADKDAFGFYRAMSDAMFDTMKERLAGTRNDILVSQRLHYPLSEIAVPALVIHGTADTIAPFDPHGKRLAAELPQAAHLFVEGGEHMTIFTHRDLVRPRVARFYEGLK